jgi:tRNA pseudouridine38-40 synthase
VQGVLGAALAQVLRCPDPVALVVAGRTDAGVHARGQVCHLDVTTQSWQALPGRSDLEPAQSLFRRLNGVLPADLRIHGVRPAPPGFDARFSAVWRRYAYRISESPAGAPALRRHDVLAVPGTLGGAQGRLDVGAMNAASSALVGLRDFAAFCRRREGATTVRTLLSFSWSREPCDDGELVVARVVADAFCHSMVRALVGGALAVGTGRREPAWLAAVADAGQRDPAVPVVAPHGLVLEQVGYPPDAELAARAAQARAVRTLSPQ